MRAFAPELLFWEGALRPGLALRIAVDGTIVDAVPAEQAPGAQRFSGQALLPGLVNAHSHAFQRLLRGRTEYVEKGRESDDFWSWRELMYRAACALEPEEVYLASRQAFVEMALSGVTCVGEFHYLHHDPQGRRYADPNELALQVIRAARDVGLRIALLRVGYARSGHGVAENPRQRRFIDPSAGSFIGAAQALRQQTAADGRVSVGLAPHSVRAVPREWLEAVGQTPGFVIHMHASEQPAEIDACLGEHGVRPVELAQQAGLLSERYTAVHGIHLSEEEIRALGDARAAVCACPSTERNLGDGVVPADALLRAGVSLCLGSDSQANIDLLDEARQLESHLRLVRLRRAVLDPGSGATDGLGQRLFEMATALGARSLGVNGGVLAPGREADFFTLQLHHPSVAGARAHELLSAAVFGASSAAVQNVYVAGEPVVVDGHHPLTRESGAAFSSLVRKVFA